MRITQRLLDSFEGEPPREAREFFLAISDIRDAGARKTACLFLAKDDAFAIWFGTVLRSGFYRAFQHEDFSCAIIVGDHAELRAKVDDLHGCVHHTESNRLSGNCGLDRAAAQ